MKLSDSTLIRLGRATALASLVPAVAGSIVFLVLGEPRALVTTFSAHAGIIAVGFGAFTWLVVPRQPRNAEVWTLAASALMGGIYVGAGAALVILSRAAGLEMAELLDLTVSGAMDEVGGVAAVPLFVVGMTTLQPLMLPMTLGWMLFPNGRLPSPRWKWVAAASVIAGIGATIGFTFGQYVPSSSLSIDAAESDITGWQGTLYAVSQTGLAVTILLALSSLVVRFRRADALVRQQFRWIMWGGTALFVSGFYPAALGDPFGAPADAALLTGEAALVVSYGMAIAKGRLYDIDVIISKTFVYGSLAAFIGAVYVGVVVGIGATFGAGADPNPVLAVTATALVAVAFQPLRARLQKIANRIVYGKRATPYQVLSEFSRQVAATDESLLWPVARLLTEGTVATAAAVWTADDGYLRRVSAWPEEEAGPRLIALGGGPLAVPGCDLVLPVVHEGETLGALSLVIPPGQPLSRPDLALADELSAGMALVMRNRQLTRRLEDRVAELRDSRRRIVAVQDETRRRLERDLHDGAQQRLVALKVKLALTRQLAQRDGATRTLELLGALSTQADEAVAVLREFARGLYPPLLQAEGLKAALAAAASRLPIAVDVAADGMGRYPREVEATVYFCVLEALHNVVKFAHATSAQVTLYEDGEILRFTVRDAGAGFDPATVPLGSGLQDIRDRLDAAGGAIDISSAPGQGTTIAGSLPLPSGALA